MSQIDELLAQIERGRRWSWLLTAIPVLAGVAFLLVTVHQVSEARRELAATQADIAKGKAELEEVQKELQQKRQQLDFLGKALWQAGPEKSREAIAKAVEAEPGLAQVAGRVYLHIREEDQRPKAREIGLKLRGLGYIVPGIERVPQGPDRSEVRYFKKTDEGEGKRLAEAVGGGAEAKYVAGHEDSKTLRARHFEVWFGPRQ